MYVNVLCRLELSIQIYDYHYSFLSLIRNLTRLCLLLKMQMQGLGCSLAYTKP